MRRPMGLPRAVLFLLGPVLLSTAMPLAATGGAPALATYRGGEVTAEEYAGWLEAQSARDVAQDRRAQLEGIALAETLEREALRAGLDADPAVRFRLDDAERGVLVQAMLRRESQAAEPTPAEVEAALLAEKGELQRPRRVRLRNIFKKVPAGAGPAERDAARKALEGVRERLRAGADFAEVALRESDSQTRFRGGLMGAVPPGVLQPEVERVAFALKEGELSAVIETPDGFTLLRCDGIVEARVMSLEEARGRIRQGLFTRRSTARQRALREELLRSASVQETLEPALAAGRDDAVAARFDGGTVTLAELKWLADGPLDARPRDALHATIEEHVFRVKLAERARQQGVDEDAAVRARVRWARARVLATFEMARRVNRVLVPPTEAEIRARFEAERKRYQKPPELDFSIIELASAPSGERDRLQAAEALAAELRAGRRDFAEAARSLSRHASARDGGRLGWTTVREAANLGPSVLRALELLGPGEVSGPVQQDDTLFVLKLWDRRPGRPLTFEEARDRVEGELGAERVADIQGRLEVEARRALGLRVSDPEPPR